MPSSTLRRRDLREALFVGGMPYQAFKDEFDKRRLGGNTLFGWARARLWPDERT